MIGKTEPPPSSRNFPENPVYSTKIKYNIAHIIPFYSSFFFSLFFNRPGNSETNAHADSKAIDVQEKASLELVIFCNVLPACMATIDGGATPKKVPTANVYTGTPITGDAKLMNQFGSMGVMRRNSI
uniref:Uncharacterized protein n=1 Tax=Ceratitis capitata TaxID=7213 RepID=W8BEZ3_CERCA